MKQNENGTVKIVWHGGDRFDIHARHHTVRVDQIRDFGGGDTGPDPVELFVGSLAACAAQRAERYLHRCELPAGVTITARYDLELRPARVSRVEMVVEAPGVPAGLRDSLSAAIEHSAVCNSLRQPPEITFRLQAAEDLPSTREGWPTEPHTPPESTSGGIEKSRAGKAGAMKAQIGDRLIIESPHVGMPRRVGVITALHHDDGSPPYDVRWGDREHEVMVFPGPDAHIEHAQAKAGPSPN